MSRHRRQQLKRARAYANRSPYATAWDRAIGRFVARLVAIDPGTPEPGVFVVPEPKAPPARALLTAVHESPGRTSGTLAKLVGCTVGTASTTLRRLCEQGKIERRAHTSTSFAYYPLEVSA